MTAAEQREYRARKNRQKNSIQAAASTLQQITQSHSAVVVIELINRDKYKSSQPNILVVTDHDDIIIRYLAICGPKNTVEANTYDQAYKQRIWANDSNNAKFDASG